MTCVVHDTWRNANNRADLAVWDRNPYSVETAALKDLKCEMTIFNGRVVFEATEDPDSAVSALTPW